MVCAAFFIFRRFAGRDENFYSAVSIAYLLLCAAFRTFTIQKLLK